MAWAAGRAGFVSMTVANSAFIDTARSWVWTVDAAGIRPPGVVWIVTDEASRAAMDAVPDSEVV